MFVFDLGVVDCVEGVFGDVFGGVVFGELVIGEGVEYVVVWYCGYVVGGVEVFYVGFGFFVDLYVGG